MKDFTIRPIKSTEIEKIADIISTAYYNDIFFKWTVPKDQDRHKIVKDYYKIYLNDVDCVAHIAESSSNDILGASVWLPHNVDISIYHKIDKAVGSNAIRFRSVADCSHYSEPPMSPFYQLVGLATIKEAQNKGIGTALLKYNLNLLDRKGIPTYLEASTPYYGKGVYGKFGYQPVGELMAFTESAVLHPLWRPASNKFQLDFGGHIWHVLERRNKNMLLLSENVIELGKYHNNFENITWSNSSVRQYLNTNFYNRFNISLQSQILKTKLSNNNNPWTGTNAGPRTLDNIFLLSIEEVLKYMGDSGQLKNAANKFFINDAFNEDRKALFIDNSPSRWFLRTPGNYQNFISVVTSDGKISVTGDFVNRSTTELFNIGIRPAMWIKWKGGTQI